MARRPGIDDPEWIDPGTVTHDQIRQVERAYWPGMAKSRHRADMSRKLTTGQLQAPIPQEFVDAVDDVSAFRIDTPFKYTEPLSIKQALAGEIPEIKREPAGIGPQAMANATKIEQASEAVLKRRTGGFRWDDMIDLALMEGVAAHITMPSQAAFDAPQMFDDTGSLKPKYKRDSLGESADAYADDLEGWYRKHPIVDYRPVSILDCAPIFGPGLRLEGLLVAQAYTESELFEQGFSWDESAGLMTPLGSGDAVGGMGSGGYRTPITLPQGVPGAQRVLFELWGYHARSRCPYVAYSVQGCRTWRAEDDGDERAAVINLKKAYGMSRLPISFEFGQSWATSDPDLRSMPYPAPFLRGWRGVDTMLTGRAIHEWRFGLAGLIEQVDDPALARVLLEKNIPPSIEARPMQVSRVFGKVVPSVPPPGGSGMQELAAFILGLTEQTTDSDVSGDAAASGYAQSVARTYAKDARYQVSEAARRHYEAAGSFTLEILTGLAKKYQRPIPIVSNYKVPVSRAPSEQNSTRDVLEFGEGLCGDDFEVTAEFKKNFGDNLALQQQAAEFVDRKLKPRRWFHEFTGETSPEVVEAEILSDQMLTSEKGIADTFALVAKIQGDQDAAMQLELQTSGQVGPDGVPSDLLAGLQGMQAQPGMPPGPPPPQGGGMTGIGSPGAAALGGQVSAGMQAGAQANTAQAGIPIAPPETPQL